MLYTIWAGLAIYFVNNKFWVMGNILKILASCSILIFVVVYILRSAPKVKCKKCGGTIQGKDIYCPNRGIEMGSDGKEFIVKKDKKKMAFLGFSIAVVFLLAFIGVIYYGNQQGYFENLATGVYTEKKDLYVDKKNVWAMEFEAALVEGELKRVIPNSGNKLKELKIEASSTSGVATLNIQQNDLTDSIDLSNTNGKIIYDLSKYENKEIRLTIEHSKLQDYYFNIEWE